MFLAALSVVVAGCDDPPDPPDAAVVRDGGAEVAARPDAIDAAVPDGAGEAGTDAGVDGGAADATDGAPEG